MLKVEKTETYGFEAAIRGMRNPLNSWDKSDSHYEWGGKDYCIGEADHALMMKLAKAGSDHRKFMRQIFVSVDITAPLYWWKEFDTYKVGTTANSCSTMHKIHANVFDFTDFSHEHLTERSLICLKDTIDELNFNRALFLQSNDKTYWHNMIQLLPSSYNQLRTVTLNYEVLRNIYHARKNHKLDEWHTLCEWIESLPYSELITERGQT